MPLGSLNPLGDSFPGLCLPSGQSSCFVPLPLIICIRTLLWVYMHPFSQDESWSRLLGGAGLTMAWNYPLTFDPSEPFCTYVMSPLFPKGGDGDLLILYSNRVLSLFVLAMGCMKHKLESRLPGEISITSDTKMTPPYGKKWRRTKESLDESEIREWKSWLKTTFKKLRSWHPVPSLHSK